MKNKNIDEGIYGECSCCGQTIYTHMADNMKYFDDFNMCGMCVTGESSEYVDELTAPLKFVKKVKS